jgi:hypothetical protein
MIGVTNDEKVFYGLLEKTTVKESAARIYTMSNKKQKRKE